MTGDAPGPAGSGPGGSGGDRLVIEVEAAACAEPEAAALEALARGDALPFAPGGAAVGRVTGAGEGGGHMIGKRVLVGPLDPCGECERCRRGLPFACPTGRVLGESAPGALSGQVTVRARWVTELGGGLDIEGPLAALVAREAADAYALHARAGLAAGEPAAVLGRGPVAALLVDIARGRGAKVVAATIADPGAAEERVAAHAAEHAAGGRPLKIFAADEGELALALRLATPGALIVALARSPREAGTAPLAALLHGGGALAGVPAAHPDLLPEGAALAVKREIDLALAGELHASPAPLADPAALAARTRAALASGRALVVAL